MQLAACAPCARLAVDEPSHLAVAALQWTGSQRLDCQLESQDSARDLELQWERESRKVEHSGQVKEPYQILALSVKECPRRVQQLQTPQLELNWQAERRLVHVRHGLGEAVTG